MAYPEPPLTPIPTVGKPPAIKSPTRGDPDGARVVGITLALVAGILAFIAWRIGPPSAVQVDTPPARADTPGPGRLPVRGSIALHCGLRVMQWDQFGNPLVAREARPDETPQRYWVKKYEGGKMFYDVLQESTCPPGGEP